MRRMPPAIRDCPSENRKDLSITSPWPKPGPPGTSLAVKPRPTTQALLGQLVQILPVSGGVGQYRPTVRSQMHRTALTGGAPRGLAGDQWAGQKAIFDERGLARSCLSGERCPVDQEFEKPTNTVGNQEGNGCQSQPAHGVNPIDACPRASPSPGEQAGPSREDRAGRSLARSNLSGIHCARQRPRSSRSRDRGYAPSLWVRT